MKVPAYDDLPVLEALGLPHSWSVFGDRSDLGTLNRLTDAVVIDAAGEVQTGQRFRLALPFDEIDPPLFGREPLQRRVFATSRNDWDECIDSFFPQASSQWDGFLHVRAREHGFYTGVVQDPVGAPRRLGVEHWAEQGVVGRGVLLDVDRHLRDTGFDPMRPHAVDAATLADVAASQGVQVRDGDIVCVRFGWTRAYRALDAEARRVLAEPSAGAVSFAGLAGSEAVARLLWDWGAAALVVDNPAAEVSPGDPRVGSLHRRLLPLLGLPIAELFDLDQLAEAAAADGRYTFLFVAAPHPLRGSLASPANALALR